MSTQPAQPEIPTSVPPAAWQLSSSAPSRDARQQTSGSASVGVQSRVLHLINGQHFSGAERVQQLLGQRLIDFGFEPHFACVKPGRFRECAGLPSARVHDFPMCNRIDVRVVARIADMIRRQEIELLHAHTPRTAMVAALVALRTRTPWVYHVHSPSARDSARPWINRLNATIERAAILGCNKVITVSRSLRREMLRLGVPRRRLAVVPNGVPAIAPIDPQQRVHQTRWRLGILALMRPRKGIEVAIEAMRLVRQRHPAIELELIGSFESEEYQQQITAAIDSAGLGNNVVLRGFTTDIAGALHRLDALLLPSLHGEGMPMVVLEALSAGVPVVATRVEGTPEVVRHGQEGLLAQPGDPHGLADRILELTASRPRWCQMSHRAVQRHRSRFSEVRMAEATARVYRSVLTVGSA
ncbi:MAG: glycosyltransferase family 1 protein [Planctomycetota bacterium]|nr:MAG: glycosyltransferase family 1 protein [Planctomycetota bacterium]